MIGHRYATPAVAAVIAACLVGSAAPARADLSRDLRQLGASFSASGSVRHLKPRFVERGGLRPLLLPTEWLDPLKDDCVTVVLLGAPSATFVVRFLPATDALSWPRGESPELSVAGAAQLVRCGIRKAMLTRLAVEMRSPRGVVEVLIARGERPFPPLTRVLAARSPGALSPPSAAGPPARPESVEHRSLAHATRARREGANAVSQRELTSDPDGRGRALFRLEPACHRLRLLASPSVTLPADIDADLVLGASTEPAASDRSEATDAVLITCVGDETPASLSYQGAPPKSAVTLVAERYPLPAGLPARWTGEERGRIAQALWQHRSPAVDLPVATARGVSGVTLLPLEVEPDGCYVAAVASTRGVSAGVALSAELGLRQAQNHGGLDGFATALSFCARGDPMVRFNVEVRGEGGAWLFALFRAGRSAVGERGE